MKQQKQVIDWFRSINMVVSSENFHLIILGKSKNTKTKHLDETDRKTGGKVIETTNSVKLLGMNVDNKLTSDDHISHLCPKVSMIFNAINWLKRYFGKHEFEVITCNSCFPKYLFNQFIALNIIGTLGHKWERIQNLIISLSLAFQRFQRQDKNIKIQRCLGIKYNDYDSD